MAPMMQEPPVFPRTVSWDRGDWPRCKTLIMQPEPGFAVDTAYYVIAIQQVASMPEAEARKFVEFVSNVWHTPIHQVWQAVHAARKKHGQAS
jgi:hypothetical protein